MVSTINILQTYYHIPLTDQSYFFYQNKNYYLSFHQTPPYYYHYLSLTHFPQFQIIQPTIINPKQDHCLYSYQDVQLPLNQILEASLIVIDTVAIQELKKSWLSLINDFYKCLQHPTNPYQNILHHFYYYLSLLAIEIFHYYFYQKDIQIEIGYQHHICTLYSREICNPDNIICASLICDLIKYYRYQYISINDVKYYSEHYLHNDNLIALMLCKTIFPTEYFDIVLHNHQLSDFQIHKQYQLLNQDLKLIKEMYEMVSQFIPVPKIRWL